MNSYRLVASIVLPHGQRKSAAKHQVHGKVLNEIHALQIVQIAGEPGFYLLYLDSAGDELTDTLHDTLGAAMEQARFEFDIGSADWQFEKG